MTTDKSTRQNRVREALGRIYDQQPPYFREYLRRFQEDPTSRVFAPLAEAYRRLGRTDEAIEICREGLEHHPDFHGGRVALAKCLVDKRQFSEARAELDRVVRAVPENLLAQRLLGEVHLVVGDRDAALHAFKMALLLSPADVGLAEKVHQLERPDAKAKAEPSPAVEWSPAPVVPERASTENWIPDRTATGSFTLDAAPMPVPREEFVEQNLVEGEDPLGAASSIDALLNEGGEDSGGDLAPLWQVEEAKAAAAAGAPIEPPPKGEGHDDMFVAEPISADGGELESLDEPSQVGPAPVELDEPIVDEGLEALLGREESLPEEPFKVEHVSSIFSEPEEGAPQEITTETLGDLYFSQGQYEQALKIFEKLESTNGSPALSRKIQACRAKLGVTKEQRLKNLQIDALRRVLGRVK